MGELIHNMSVCEMYTKRLEVDCIQTTVVIVAGSAAVVIADASLVE